MSNFVIIKSIEYKPFGINRNDLSIVGFTSDKEVFFPTLANPHEFKLKKSIQPKEQVFFLRNIIKAINSGFVDFTDDKLYDFSFENSHAKNAGGVNSKFIDSDLKAEYKKEFDLYYQKMSEFIEANKNLAFSAFMPKLSEFFTMVSTRSKFKETAFELREKFYEYLTDKFTL